MRLGLPTTLMGGVFIASIWKLSWKWIKRKTHTYRIIVWQSTWRSKTQIADACVLWHAHRVQRTSQRAILSFSNVLVWTVQNVSKRQCGRESIDSFSMTGPKWANQLLCTFVQHTFWYISSQSLLHYEVKLPCRRSPRRPNAAFGWGESQGHRDAHYWRLRLLHARQPDFHWGQGYWGRDLHLK